MGYRTKGLPFWLVFAVAGACFALQPAQAQTTAPLASQPGKRIALLIGNAAYKGDRNASTIEWNRLDNAAKDARDIGNELKKLGFRPDDVEVLQDTGRRDMLLALARFKERARKADQVVFYYSGHGVQDDSLNYLIPVDAPDRRRSNLVADSVALKEVLDAVAVGPGQKVVMIDACRTPAGSKGDGGGLANPEKERPLPPGVTVVFAAGAGQSALDGRGQPNGFFAQGLLEGLRQNDTSLINVLLVADAKVSQLSGGMQEVTPFGSPQRQRQFAFAPLKATPPTVDPRDVQLAEARRQIEELSKRPATVAAAPVQTASATQTAPAAPSILQPGTETRAYSGGPIMVTLPQGSYLRGSHDEDGRFPNEGAMGTVTIAYSLQVGKTEITRAEFAAFVLAKNYKTQAEYHGAGCTVWTGKEWKYDAGRNWRSVGFEQTDSHPVVCISWNDAQEYVIWINEKAGLSQHAPNRFRLPSETEFEFAARGVTTPTESRSGAQHTRFYWGNDIGYKQVCGNANLADKTASKQFSHTADCSDGFPNTAPVASFGNTAQTRHPFGLSDMLGNVWEWAQDCYVDSYSKTSKNGRAYETFTIVDGCRRVIRGGGWHNSADVVRSAIRDAAPRNSAANYVGFRLARTVF